MIWEENYEKSSKFASRIAFLLFILSLVFLVFNWISLILIIPTTIFTILMYYIILHYKLQKNNPNDQSIQSTKKMTTIKYNIRVVLTLLVIFSLFFGTIKISDSIKADQRDEGKNYWLWYDSIDNEYFSSDGYNLYKWDGDARYIIAELDLGDQYNTFQFYHNYDVVLIEFNGPYGSIWNIIVNTETMEIIANTPPYTDHPSLDPTENTVYYTEGSTDIYAYNYITNETTRMYQFQTKIIDTYVSTENNSLVILKRGSTNQEDGKYHIIDIETNTTLYERSATLGIIASVDNFDGNYLFIHYNYQFNLGPHYFVYTTDDVVSGQRIHSNADDNLISYFVLKNEIYLFTNPGRENTYQLRKFDPHQNKTSILFEMSIEHNIIAVSSTESFENNIIAIATQDYIEFFDMENNKKVPRIYEILLKWITRILLVTYIVAGIFSFKYISNLKD